MLAKVAAPILLDWAYAVALFRAHGLFLINGSWPVEPSSDAVILDDMHPDLWVRVDLSASTVVAWFDDGLDSAALVHLLIDLVLPKALAGSGRLILHSGLVRCGDTAFAIVGPSGRGKSSLVASLHLAGFNLIGDDTALVDFSDGHPFCNSLYPGLRLLNDSLINLFPPSTKVTDLADYTSKKRIQVSACAPGQPLRAVFSLAPASHTMTCSRLSRRDAFVALLENAFALDPFNTTEGRHRMQLTTQLTQQVPVFELSYPRRYDALPEVHHLIHTTLMSEGHAP